MPMRYDLVAGDRLVAATAPSSEYREGISLGAMVVEYDDIFRDAVNNAVRLEEIPDDAIFHQPCDPTETD